MSRETIGLIAGTGQFPVLFARAARRQGIKVVAVAHKGETFAELEGEVDQIQWIQLGKLGKLIKTFKKAGVSRAVMCGGVKKTRMFTDVRPDLKALSVIGKMRHMADDGILRTLSNVLRDEGITIMPSHQLVPELLAAAGLYTKREATQGERLDAELGWSIARDMGGLDIGQCLVLKDKVVLAVEAVEGTDACIERGGGLCGGGAVVVKRAKPTQDLRFDLPSVGAMTVEVMARAGAVCLVIEAGRTLVFDREEMVKAADRAGICIMAWENEEASGG